MTSINKKFVNYLSNCKKRKTFTQDDFMQLEKHIYINYRYNRLNIIDESQTNQLPSAKRKHQILTGEENEEITITPAMPTQSHRQVQVQEQSTYAYPIEKPKKIIKTDVSNIGDLLRIIEENEYNPCYQYNIDLQGLHNISKELYSLQNMIGMQQIKETIIRQLLYFIQRLHITCVGSDYKHTVIYGPPGTGKTKVAQILGTMYSKLGILRNNVFKKVTRQDLISGYLGQTAIKTSNVINDCLGGVLFIDEAYSLADQNKGSNDSYSKECIDTLCESLSDNKDNLMVIVAGYKKELDETFFSVNKGMDSRFIWRFTIEPYNYNELNNIFLSLLAQEQWQWSNNVSDTQYLLSWFNEKHDSFTYFGRDMESLLTHVKIAYARRIYGKEDTYKKIITIDDLNAGYSTFLENRKVSYEKPLGLHMMYT